MIANFSYNSDRQVNLDYQWNAAEAVMLVTVARVSGTGTALFRFMGNSVIWIFLTQCLLISVCTSSIDSDANVSNESRRHRVIDPNTTLGCHRREYTFTAVRTDEYGRRCTDKITVLTCWGRCETGEVPDWKFPFKRSFHPVCIPQTMRWRTVELRNCDADASLDLMEYRYLEPLSCKCQLCQSSIASCEGLLGTRAP